MVMMNAEQKARLSLHLTAGFSILWVIGAFAYMATHTDLFLVREAAAMIGLGPGPALLATWLGKIYTGRLLMKERARAAALKNNS
jgi:hypothetical protein